ncbi:MAG: FkbM family methyltransferase [Beijerinckiaceae bacterium]|nr:FkbM family methyltransferase [Beijerinckiaceae bacterium]MCZ8301815.1 FkbM family methyltransferase [Beijerinckiaceae bacterium]
MTDLLNKPLEDADVEALYLAILRRAPESAETIRSHRESSRTVGGLLNALLGSQEYRQRIREWTAGSMQLTGEPPHCFVTHTHDDAIGMQVRWNGHFEEHHVGEVVRRLGVDPAAKPWFVDIGANIGTHSLFALRNGFGQALCVEPEPRNFRLLRVNQILNGVDARCRNVMAAVTDFNGEITLELADDNLGDHRVQGSQPGEEHFRESGRQLVQVPARMFDDILREQDVDPGSIGLVWIDTQGHEGQVLSRAGSLLAHHVPMVIEFWPYGLDRVAGYPRLREVLARCGRIETVRSGERMDLAAVDAVYAALLQQPEKGAAYLDLVLLP